MMDSLELSTILQKLFGHTKVNYAVVPCDGLEDINWNHFPVAIIANNQSQKHAGEHWLAIWCESRRGPFHFICSYGLGIRSYDPVFLRTAEELHMDVVENTRPLQSLGATCCGAYCAYALYKFYSGCCLMSLYHNFSNDTKSNDRKVVNFVNRFLRNPSKFYYKYQNQCCTPFGIQ